MRMFQTPALAFLASLTLMGCKSELALSIFSSDVQAAAEGQADRTATAVLGIEAIRCPERGPLALPAIQTGFPTADFIGCRDAGMQTYAEYRIRLPLLKLDPKQTPPAPMNLALAPYDDRSTLGLLFVDNSQIQAIADALPRELRYGGSGDFNPVISLRVHNDTAAHWTFTVQGVFVDGSAKQLPTEITLAPREEALIRLSDVGNAAIRGNRPILFYLNSP